MFANSTTLKALRHRNFRLLWIGQLISVSGSMMNMAAVLWHVSLLVSVEDKGLALGLVGLVRIAPIIIFSLISGVVADAIDRRKLMLIAQSGMALVSAAMALLAFNNIQVLWPIYALTCTAAAFRAFDAPARQSLIPNLVPRSDLPNAISLNTIMFQTASVLGPALAGFVLATLGIGWAYTFDALSFLSTIIALVLMRNVPTHDTNTRHEISLRAAGDGLRFVFSAPLIRSTMLLDFFATFFSSAMALLPIFVQDILNLREEAYGLLYAAPAVGAAITSVVMVKLTDRIEHRGWTLLGAVIVYGLATVVFGISRSYALTFLCLALTGAADTVSVVMRNLVRHLTTPDHLRGRMTSVNMIFFMGGPQLGELEAGLVAHWATAPISVITGGIGCIIATLWLALKTPQLRRYRREDPLITSQPVAAEGISK